MLRTFTRLYTALTAEPFTDALHKLWISLNVPVTTSLWSQDRCIVFQWIVFIRCRKISFCFSFLSDINEAEILSSRETTVLLLNTDACDKVLSCSLLCSQTPLIPCTYQEDGAPSHHLFWRCLSFLFIATFMFLCRALLEASAALLFCISKACIQTQPSDLICE